MICPSCGAEMEFGWMMFNKTGVRLTWAPRRYQFPFPQKGAVVLRSTEKPPTVFDFTEYPSHICKTCKTLVFQYE